MNKDGLNRIIWHRVHAWGWTNQRPEPWLVERSHTARPDPSRSLADVVQFRVSSRGVRTYVPCSAVGEPERER